MSAPGTSPRSLIWTALKAGRLSTVLLLVFSLLDAVILVSEPPLLGATLNSAMTEGSASALVWIVIGLLVVGIVVESLKQVVDFSSRYRAVRVLRGTLLTHLTRLGYRGQRRFNQGDLVNRLIDSTDRTARAASASTGVLTAVISSFGGLIGLFVIDWQVGLAFVLSVPAILYMTMRHLGTIVNLSGDAAAAQGEIATRMMDSIRGLRTIRASGTAEQEIDRALASSGQLRAISLRIWDGQRALVWQTAVIAPLLVIIVLVVAGYRLTIGQITAGEMFAAAAYVALAIGALQIFGSAKDIAETLAASRRLGELLDEPPLAPGSRELPEGRGELTFTGVGSRIGDRRILRDVTFVVPAGRTIALVGESGVGKSTLTAIAGGVLAPDEGVVTFDGVPIGEVRAESLRRAVVYAFERPVLLGETIADALRYGDDTVSDAALHAALRSTDADGFVARLPDRHETPVEGLRLSGGEVQRLGLARAACREARVFVMDDALSSVDTSTEASISAALGHMSRGATRLLVAHRASTAARADQVIWLHGGTVGGIGTHAELLADPAYRAVFAVSGEAGDRGGSADEEPDGAPDREPVESASGS